jgi:IS5 family transposase
MQPTRRKEDPDLFRTQLVQILDIDHPLCRLGIEIDWTTFDKEFGATYNEGRGRPGCPTRLMVGLHYIKYTFDLSDEMVVRGFLENPYWQYFCGYEYFRHSLPIDSSSMTRFRKRIGHQGAEKILKELIDTAKRGSHLKESHMSRVNVDTTVQEKAIAFPTDARLYFKMRARLVRAAESRGIQLRQTYKRKAKAALVKQGRYSHASQYNRAKRQTKALKTMLGCVYRDIKRKVEDPDVELKSFLDMAERLLLQEKNSKNKLYSIHEPSVECISKGKVHKKYEFGNKVGLVTTSKGNWVVGVQSFHENPYDGHTLSDSLDQTERLTGWTAKEAYVDLGYRGHGYEGDTHVNIVNYRTINKLTRSVKKWFKRRNAVEPIIGHLKSDNRMARNLLKGTEGDRINAILCGCGFNMRKLLAVFFLPYFLVRYFAEKIVYIILILNNNRSLYRFSWVNF